ncbi:phosphoglucosamine mutase [Peptococcus niger]|uniref:Phosphoglucosamine mutase n=1 Tax=Peptococcus niger TaxID=2741 RepID=A0A1G6S9N3_PEPNI|nr:phosphoglucosamine mutase [Peptococcus niger]SDD13632.1 phosphoglucosamine mutase [Peptococcus niger]
MNNLFGTDGVRGRVGQTLTPELAYRLGRAAGTVLAADAQGDHRTVVIGRDSRLSGQMLEAALTAGLTATGMDVISCGLIPTPAVAWLVRTYHAVAGVVISASHNPYWDNGIKFFNQAGLKLSDDKEDEIARLVEKTAELPYAAEDAIGQVMYDGEAVERYKDFLLQQAQFKACSLKAVVDCANGSASPIAEKLFSDLGLKVIMRANHPDGVNINADCGSTHMDGLIEAVLAEGADIGLAFDGDADRFLAVAADGSVIDGDQLMSIYAHDLQARGELDPNLLVVTVMSNLGLKLAMKKSGVDLVETQVGDRYVNEALTAHDGVLGGEQSGHIIFRRINSTGDGLLSALMLLNIMVRQGLSLKELAASMQRMPQILVNVKVRDKNAWADDERISAVIARVEAALGETGRVLVRASGTEPLLRVMVEGENKAEIDQLAHEIADEIDAVLGI